MFVKFVVLLGALAFAAAKPGFLAPALLGSHAAVVNEATISSHGNSVVHASAPVVTGYASPVVAAVAPAVLAEKTISSHGHSIVHASAPAITSYAAPAPALLSYAPVAPVYYHLR
ncbi:pupal cuticle protein G1A-like [Copidosoma floridanum]|uniref:pupal cuticle protein G1A-like n=1 Tax=Copidosoma floridanum TaxID=29053 RepID=UPI0006C94C94|nr:pupal cuticle protein G1A-like [Copidosoma floridanum]